MINYLSNTNVMVFMKKKDEIKILEDNLKRKEEDLKIKTNEAKKAQNIVEDLKDKKKTGHNPCIKEKNGGRQKIG